MQRYLERVVTGVDLTTDEARSAAADLVTTATDAQIGALLAALRTKGVAAGELAGFALALRDACRDIDPDVHPLVDTCGTGGDAYDTINISTTSAIVAAAAGVTVAKHGNHAVSSSSGSADVLAELGVDLDVDPATVEAQLAEIGLGYLHAPAFHPSMARVGPARQELGIRTVFNLVGPLSNPAGATRHVLGAHSESAVDLLAGAVTELAVEHALVVHGSGIDEITVHDTTTVAEVRGGRIERYTITPSDLGLATHPVASFAGGTPRENAAAIRAILSGERTDGGRDVVLANAGAAVYVGGEAPTLAAGVDRAADAIDDGLASDLLGRLVEGRPAT